MNAYLVTALLVLSACSTAASGFSTPLGTAFTYQGQLKVSGTPVDDTADFEFRIFASSVGGTPLGSMVPINGLTVTDGLFTVSIDFGASAFNGDARWLEIAVRSPAGSGTFTTLTPRQRIMPTPYALQTRGIFVDSNNNVGIGTTDTTSLLTVGSPATRGTLNIVGSTSVIPLMSLTDSRPGGHQYTLYGGLNGIGTLDIFHQNSATTRLSINAVGNVGIGTTTPATKLHVNGQSLWLSGGNGGGLPISTGAGLRVYHDGSRGQIFAFDYGTGTNRDLILQEPGGSVGIGTTTLTHKLTVNGDMHIGAPNGSSLEYGLDTRLAINKNLPAPFTAVLVEFKANGVTEGSIVVSGSNVSYNGFMGSHYAWLDGEHSIARGALVRMTGKNRRLNDSAESDVVYGIEQTANANDPACLGAYLDIMESDKPADLGNPHLVAAVGNGEMLVVDSGNGDIQPGDLLISADVPGCAMKDDPRRFVVGYVVGRAAQRVDWSAVTPEADGGRVARVSVFFESFVRNSMPTMLGDPGEFDVGRVGELREKTQEIARFQSKLAEKEAEIASLNGRVAQLERLMRDVLANQSRNGGTP